MNYFASNRGGLQNLHDFAKFRVFISSCKATYTFVLFQSLKVEVEMTESPPKYPPIISILYGVGVQNASQRVRQLKKPVRFEAGSFQVP